MNILLIGSGAREHALAWALAQSADAERLFVAPGNAGTATLATNVALDPADHAAVVAFCRSERIGLVVVGPEAPLVAGLVDALEAAGILAFGPTAAAARLEGSKRFTKELCERFDIPTARFASFNNAAKAKDYIRRHGAPVVVKADGLAAGKGVTVASTVAEACAAVDDCFEGAFGSAGACVVIEEMLEGEEVSLFALCDGHSAVLFGTAQDHKRVGEGDTGPNTGGMGAISPAAAVTPALETTVMTDIIVPTLAAMHHAGAPFRGVLFAGLMLTADGPKLIEFNVRFGDPECQALMMRLDSDLLPILVAAAEGDLGAWRPQWSEEVSVAVVMAARGYPGAAAGGTAIAGLEDAEAEGATVFQAGTRLVDDQVLAGSGRTLTIAARGRSFGEAAARAYRAVDRIDWGDGFCRRDIGWRAIARERARA